MVDLPAQYAGLKDSLDAAVLSVLSSGKYILGENVTAVETEIARSCGASHAIGLNSGTDALLLALLALDIKAGDEIITTPFTFVATAEMIALIGAKPIFADIDPATFNLDPASVEAKITSRTKAILPVHLFGQMADMTALTPIAQAHGLPLIGDAAQAIGCEHHGRPLASWTSLTTLSFFPTKNLGAAGDGGMILTNDDALAEKLQYLRFHGSKGTYHYKYVGICSRLDAIQAAVLGVKLPRLADWNEARRANAAAYTTAFSSLPGVTTPVTLDGNVHTYHQYTLRIADGRRDGLRQHLVEREIASGVYYPGALHLQEAYLYLGGKPGDCPEAERTCEEVLSLPIMPELTPGQRDYVIESVRSYFQN